MKGTKDCNGTNVFKQQPFGWPTVRQEQKMNLDNIKNLNKMNIQ